MVIIFGQRLSWLAALLLIGAVWRCSRLIITDQWPGWYQLRERILVRWPAGPARATELLVCPWCNSMWLAAVAVTMWLLFPGPTLAVCLLLTVSAIAAVATAWTTE